MSRGQPRISAALRVDENPLHVGDIGLLLANDEPRAGADLRLQFEEPVSAHTGIEFGLNGVKQRFELIEILTPLAAGDFLCSAFSAVVRTWRIP